MRFRSHYATPGAGYTGGIKIASKQFGWKASTHMRDWGLDVKNAADRDTFRGIIEGIPEAPDKVVEYSPAGDRQ
jgi:hypothetical protein